ncbi:MAG: hypothetical protein ABSD20_08110 [Terriglobales bacterium]|jgi:hypothetical protein
MLGELIGESHGKRAPRRVLETGPGSFKVEVSFEDSGKIFGHDFGQFVTYTAEPRPDGTLYGEGHGVVVLHNGEAATWKGAGVGTLKAGGAVSYRGAVFYYSTSPTLARLNNVAAIFEFEVDPAGNTHTRSWEWK